MQEMARIFTWRLARIEKSGSRSFKQCLVDALKRLKSRIAELKRSSRRFSRESRWSCQLCTGKTANRSRKIEDFQGLLYRKEIVQLSRSEGEREGRERREETRKGEWEFFSWGSHAGHPNPQPDSEATIALVSPQTATSDSLTFPCPLTPSFLIQN